MEENQVINEINEEVMDTVYDEVSTSNGNVIAKVVIIAGLTAITILGYRAYKKRKQYCELNSADIIEDSNVVEIDDKNEE